MMNRSLRILLWVLLAMAAQGCQDSDSDKQEYSASTQALKPRNFGKTGGAPWERSKKFSVLSSTSNAKLYGSQVALGDINADGLTDIISAYITESGAGRVDINYGNSHSEFSLNPSQSNAQDRFGTVLEIGDFCPELGAKGDIIAASAPNYANGAGAFGLIYRTSAVKVHKRFLHPTAGEHAGTAFTIADINGDGKSDLIYQTTSESDHTKVHIVYDICHSSSSLNPAQTLGSEETGHDFGGIIKVHQLNDSDRPEVIIADTKQNTISFYQIIDGKAVISRPDLTLDTIPKAIEFTDLDQDGQTDIVLGLPYSPQMNGSVMVLKNPGSGKPFSTEQILWKTTGESSLALYGMTIHISDLNKDGRDDLIVAAPVEDENAGKLYVYMGTQDGSGFSEAYWQYKGSAPTAWLGSSIATGRLNTTDDGWLDIAAGTPLAQPHGIITVFYQDKRPCYTADKCLVDDICYENGEHAPGLNCQICDPYRNNFGFSDLSCSTPDPCQTAAACSESSGCTFETQADGTPCGPSYCSHNELVANTCQDGVCTKTSTSCGIYTCDETLTTCPDSCHTDSDCSSGYICQHFLNMCIAEAENHTPTVIAQMYDSKGKPLVSGFISTGDYVTIDLSKSYDLDFDPLTYSLQCYENSTPDIIVFNSTLDSSKVSFTQDGNYTCIASVNDGHIDSTEKRLYITVSTNNQRPIAVPEIIYNEKTGNKMTVTLGDTVKIDSSHSYDPDGDAIIAWDWSIYKSGTANSPSISQSYSNESFDFTPPYAGEYNIMLYVTDSRKLQSYGREAFLTVGVRGNQPPVIQATVTSGIKTGTHIYAYPNEPLTFDASRSYDPDGDELSFHWSGFNGLDANTAIATANAMSEPNELNVFGTYGSYVYTVTVSDSAGNMATQEVYVSVIPEEPNNNPPVAVVSDYTGYPGESVTLDASHSYDPDGDMIYYLWTGDFASTLNNIQFPYPSFTIPKNAKPGDQYVFTVTVKDDKGGQDSATSTVTVVPPIDNHAPVAILPDHLSVMRYSEITVDGSQSYDPDGDPLNYAWSVTGPCQITSISNASATIQSVPDPHENYCLLTLTVTDPDGASSTIHRAIAVVGLPSHGGHVFIITPKDNEIVDSPVTITGSYGGLIGPNTVIDVYNAGNGELICSTFTTQDPHTWTCQASLKPGTYTIFATPFSDISDLSSEPVTFTVKAVTPVDPVEPVEPIEPPVDPVDPVDPVEPPVDPVVPVDPVEPPVDPVVPVDPIEPIVPPVVDPTDPPIDPTDPPIDPIPPVIDPTDPIIPEPPASKDEDKYGNVKGGACSAMPQNTSSGSAYLLFLPALFLLRRRRLCKHRQSVAQ